MADIKKLKVDGVDYSIKDAEARAALSGKQDTLVNQSNIKSVNGTTLLGEGDLQVGTIFTEDAAVGDPIVTGYVPAGGTTGQVLTKTSDTDFDTSWQNPSTVHLYHHRLYVQFLAVIQSMQTSGSHVFNIYSTSSQTMTVSDLIAHLGIETMPMSDYRTVYNNIYAFHGVNYSEGWTRPFMLHIYNLSTGENVSQRIEMSDVIITRDTVSQIM